MSNELTRRTFLKLSGLFGAATALSWQTPVDERVEVEPRPPIEVAQPRPDDDRWERVICWIDGKPLRDVWNAVLEKERGYEDFGHLNLASGERIFAPGDSYARSTLSLAGVESDRNTDLLYQSLSVGTWYDVAFGRREERMIHKGKIMLTERKLGEVSTVLSFGLEQPRFSLRFYGDSHKGQWSTMTLADWMIQCESG